MCTGTTVVAKTLPPRPRKWAAGTISGTSRPHELQCYFLLRLRFVLLFFNTLHTICLLGTLLSIAIIKHACTLQIFRETEKQWRVTPEHRQSRLKIAQCTQK